MSKDRIQWMNCNGQEILYADFSGLNNEKFIETIIDVGEFLENSGKDDFYGLFNFYDSFVDMSCFEELQQSTDLSFSRNLKRIALIGADNIQDVFVIAIKVLAHLDLQTFAYMDDAVKWLVAE